MAARGKPSCGLSPHRQITKIRTVPDPPSVRKSLSSNRLHHYCWASNSPNNNSEDNSSWCHVDELVDDLVLGPVAKLFMQWSQGDCGFCENKTEEKITWGCEKNTCGTGAGGLESCREWRQGEKSSRLRQVYRRGEPQKEMCSARPACTNRWAVENSAP